MAPTPAVIISTGPVASQGVKRSSRISALNNDAATSAAPRMMKNTPIGVIKPGKRCSGIAAEPVGDVIVAANE